MPNVKKQTHKKVRYFEFLREIWKVEPFAHFPVFGTFDAGDLDITFREQIANETGLTLELVTDNPYKNGGVLTVGGT